MPNSSRSDTFLRFSCDRFKRAVVRCWQIVSQQWQVESHQISFEEH